jgi:hypothetical protein
MSALDRMERHGLVSSRLGDPPQRGGKRSVATASGAGETLLRESQRVLARMAGAVPRRGRHDAAALPLLLVQLLLPRALREPIAGDSRRWRAAPRPSALHFWNLALRSIASCWIDRCGPVIVRPAHSQDPRRWRHAILTRTFVAVSLRVRNPSSFAR